MVDLKSRQAPITSITSIASTTSTTSTATAATNATRKSSHRRWATKTGFALLLLLSVLSLCTLTANRSIIGTIPAAATCLQSSRSCDCANSTDSTRTTNDVDANDADAGENDYQWLGNHWIPPPGIPTYNLQQIQETFSKHHTLIVGDSTARRMYGTLSQLLKKQNSSADVTVRELDTPYVIDINKHRGLPQWCKQRDFVFPKKNQMNVTSNATSNATSEISTSILQQVWDHPADKRAFHCRDIAASPHHALRKDMPMMRFDFGQSNCYKDLLHFADVDAANDRAISKNYTLIVFGIGIWEVVNPRACKMQRNVTQRLQDSFDRMRDWATAVMWRTSGYDATNSDTQLLDDLNERSRGLAKKLQQEEGRRNVDVVDWGKAMLPRSFPPQRIQGDIDAHYGLEARLLCIQMLVHKLRQLE